MRLSLDVLQVRGAECVVMAGDPKQLPPTLMSDGALDAQMDRTLFDRLQEIGAPFSVLFLDVQHLQMMARQAGCSCRDIVHHSTCKECCLLPAIYPKSYGLCSEMT